MYGEVISTTHLSSHLVRVVLGGPGLEGFVSSGFADEYVNCFFLPATAPYSAPFQDEDIRGLPREQRPFPRRITVRSWDSARGELALDIAAHGDVGHAGRWATHATPGDRLQLRGPAGGYRPHPEADSYLLVGDESALPAIAACAEAVPAGRHVVAVVEVEDAAWARCPSHPQAPCRCDGSIARHTTQIRTSCSPMPYERCPGPSAR